MKLLDGSYSVFFDTNALKGKHWLNADIREGVNKLKAQTKVSINLYVAEVAQREWIRFFRLAAEAQYEKIKSSTNALKDMNIESEVKARDTSELEIRGKAYLKKLGIEVIATPYDEINLKDLLDLAIDHKPPFEENSDKGLKDAIIARTIYSFSKTQPNSKIVFVTQDKRLMEYLGELFGEKKIRFYMSIDEFESVLRLEINKLDDELGLVAKRKFFGRDKKHSVYYNLNVRGHIRDKYLSEYPNSVAAIKRLKELNFSGYVSFDMNVVDDKHWSFGINRARVGESIFVDLVGERLYWSTSVTYAQQLVADNLYSLFHSMTFDVEWSAELGERNRLLRPTLESITKSSEEKIADIASVNSSQNMLFEGDYDADYYQSLYRDIYAKQYASSFRINDNDRFSQMSLRAFAEDPLANESLFDSSLDSPSSDDEASEGNDSDHGVKK